jgi:transposase
VKSGSTLTGLFLNVIWHLGRDYLPATTKVREKNTARTVAGNPHIKSILIESAWAATRTKNTYLSTKFWKLAARRGKKKALIAIAHKLLVIIYQVIKRKQSYIDLGVDYMDEVAKRAKAKKLIRELQALGYTTKQPGPEVAS